MQPTSLLLTLLLLAIPTLSFPHLSLHSLNSRSLEARWRGCSKRDDITIPKYMCYWKGGLGETPDESAERKAYQAEQMKKTIAIANGDGPVSLEKLCDPVTLQCPKL